MYDTIVIGLGAMGSATACHLAQRGQSVLGLEQFGLGHALGSSHGQTRIIRKAYFEHPDYVPLLESAYRHWHALAASVDYEIINICGLVLAGRNDDAVVAGTRRAAAAHDLPLEEVSPSDAPRRFPTVHLDPAMAVLFDPVGGYLRVENCVKAHLSLARESGAELHENEAVVSWAAASGGVEVRTDRDTYRARNLAVCAGPWSSAVLRALELPLQTHRVVTAWFQPDGGAHRLEDGAPVFAIQSPDGFFYGFPQLDERGVKIAEHYPRTPLPDPSAIDRNVSPADVARLQGFAQGYLSGIDTGAWTANTCIYTMTPDSDFILDRHPQHDNVYIAAGFSGHGFKFASVIGAVMADFCERGATAEPVGFLGLGRFRGH